jgi:uncharacterized protein YyaL (SSP411 family)
MAVTALLKLAGFTNDLRTIDIAHQALAQMQPMMAQYPLGFGQWLQALDHTLAKPKEIAIIGERQKADTRAMLRVVAENDQPFQIIAIGDPDTRTPVIPLLQDREQIYGRATAYVCVDFSCRPPVPAYYSAGVQMEEVEKSILLMYNVRRYWVYSGLSRKTSDDTFVAFLTGAFPGDAGWETSDGL